MEKLASNKKAYFNYEILETLEAGLVLLGTEIKSLRSNGGDLQDGYVAVIKGELYLKNTSIAPYRFGNLFNHEEKRDRKLLLHKRERLRLQETLSTKGLSVIPLEFYLKNGFAKVKLGFAKGKKNFDKRASLKAKSEKKSIQQTLKEYNS